jgi:hypothetical protein
MSGIIGAGSSSSSVPAEFSNVAGQTFPSMQTGVVLATAASGEALRVRDVSITQTIARPWRLRLGSTPLLTGNGSAVLSGDEVVLPGSPLTIDTLDVVLFNRLGLFNGTGTHRDITTRTIFASNREVSTLIGTSSIADPSTALTITPNFTCIGVNGDFFYASLGSILGNTLYRRAGGINGTQTTVTTGATFCYDGSRYLYIIDTGNIREYDTQTATLGSAVNYSGELTSFAMSTDNSHHSAALDRYVVHRAEAGNSFHLYLINALTGVVTRVKTSTFGDGNRNSIGFNRLTNGNYIATAISSSTASFQNLGPTLTAPLIDTTMASTGYAFTNNNNNYNSLLPVSAARNIILQMTNAGTSGHYAYDLDTGARIISNASSSSLYNSTYTSWFIRPTDATIAGTDFGTTAARVTGERFRI